MLQNRWLHVVLVLFFLIGSFLCLTAESFVPTVGPLHKNSVKATSAVASADTAVLTYKYDNMHSGETTYETLLTPENVNVEHFGKRLSYPVDGQIYAQPLYVPDLLIAGKPRDVVFVATEHDSVYAFDADATDSDDGLLWHTSLLPDGALTPTNQSVSCNDTIPEMGITGTPVIDMNTQTLYVVSFTQEQGQFVDRLHVLDLATGKDKASLVISASVPGYGSGTLAGKIAFNAQRERQRSALLLANGQVYIAWGSFCDDNPYHGWLMSYAFDGTSLHQMHVFNDSPDAGEGGIWGSGGGLSADAQGNIYFISGNGSFTMNTGGQSLGDSVVKLSPDLRLLDYFTPFNQACLAQADADFGSSGPLLEPAHAVIIAAGKEGRIYMLNGQNMQHYHTIANPCSHQNLTTVDVTLQESVPRQIGGLFNTPSYWNGSVYLASVNRPTGAYRLTSAGLLSSFTPTSQTPETFSFTGGNLVISSNGTQDGILWTLDAGGTNGEAALRAYDATNLARELYNSNQNPDRDALDGFVKFTCPTVANGEVFVPTSSALDIYGQINGSAPPPPASYNNTGISDDSPSGHLLANYDGSRDSYSENALKAAGITPGASLLVHGQAFIWPDLPTSTRDNYEADGQMVRVVPVAQANKLAFLGSATNGDTSGTATLHYSDGSSQDFTLGLTDWLKSTPAFGNTLAATLAYRNTLKGHQMLKNYLFSAEVDLQPGKTLRSVTLPVAPDGPGRLHIFAFATTGPFGSYDNIGTSDNSAPAAANFDGLGDSYSAQALQADGCNPGDNAFFGGTTGTVFQWPSGTSGAPNNIIATGQTLPINPLAQATLLAFVGASVGGPVSGTATIHYSDGSEQTFQLGFSDWTLTQGTERLAFANQVMYSMPYHNTARGRAEVKTYLFYAAVALQPGKTVQSVTLPGPTGTGQMHIFAIATKAGSTSAAKARKVRG